MAHSLTIQLSDVVYQYLQKVSTFTKQPLEALVQQSVEGNLPPRITNTPFELQQELLAMQTDSVQELQKIANSQCTLFDTNRHLELLEKNSAGAITPAEQIELAALRQQADRLMVRKAYAWALLRWHGQPIPKLEDIALN